MLGEFRPTSGQGFRRPDGAWLRSGSGAVALAKISSSLTKMAGRVRRPGFIPLPFRGRASEMAVYAKNHFDPAVCQERGSFLVIPSETNRKDGREWCQQVANGQPGSECPRGGFRQN